MSVTDLRKFLTELSINPARLADFYRDSNATMEAANLDWQAQRVLRSGSAAAMWNLVLGRPVTAFAEAQTTLQSDSGMERGSLIVVGTGIRTVGQLTLEAIAWIKESDVVLYLVADPIAEEVIRHLNPNGAISLRGYYG